MAFAQQRCQGRCTVAFLSDALSELVTLAAPPGMVEALAADDSPAPIFAFDDQALALRAIEAGVDDARATGTRAAVCVADLTAVDGTTPAGGAFLDAADAWLLSRLRANDRLYRIGGTFVIVASGFSHPQEGERLADRVQALPSAGGAAPNVGLAIYPTHGDDATTLLDRARTSARRATLHRRSSDLALVPARVAARRS